MEKYNYFYETFNCEEQVEFIYSEKRYFMCSYRTRSKKKKWALYDLGQTQVLIDNGYETIDDILNAKLFDGKSFNEIFDEVDIEAYC